MFSFNKSQIVNHHSATGKMHLCAVWRILKQNKKEIEKCRIAYCMHVVPHFQLIIIEGQPSMVKVFLVQNNMRNSKLNTVI